LQSKNWIRCLIKEVVEQCECEYPDKTYIKCLKKVEKANLKDITTLKTANGKSIIKSFLYEWGTMGRVLGRKEFQGWESRLKKQVESNLKELTRLRKKHLEHVYLYKYEQDIRKCYNSFRQAVKSPIAAAKTLHLICPDFFPAWDNSIADAIRKECEENKDEEFSATDYFNFMKVIQSFLKRNEQVLTELARRYKKRKMRIVDEFFWWIVRRPLHFYLKKMH